MTILLSLVTPSTAGEMWEQLGHQPSVAQASWPEVDPALLEQDAVTAVVQVQGTVRARSEADLEAVALADETGLAGDRRPRGATCARPSWSASSCDLRADG